MRRRCLSTTSSFHLVNKIATPAFTYRKWIVAQRNVSTFQAHQSEASCCLVSRKALNVPQFRTYQSSDREAHGLYSGTKKALKKASPGTVCAHYSNDAATPQAPLPHLKETLSYAKAFNWEDDEYLRHPWRAQKFGRDLWCLWVGRQLRPPDADGATDASPIKEIYSGGPTPNNAKMLKLSRELLSGGRSVVEISKRWSTARNMVLLKEMMYFLFRRGNTRLALRFVEGYVSTPMRHIPSRGQYQAEVVDAVFGVLLKEIHLSRFRKFGGQRVVRAWNRGAKLANLAIVMLKQDLFTGIKQQLKLLMQVTTPAKTLELYRELRDKSAFLAEGVHLMFLFHFARNSFFTEAFGIFQEICGLHGRLGDTYRSPARLWAFRELFVQLYRSGVPIHTSDLLQILFSYNKTVDHQIHGAFLFSAAKAGDIQQAQSLFQNAEAVTGKPPTIHLYTALFNMYHMAHDREGMQTVHGAAVQAGLEPEKDVFFVNAMLHAESRLVWPMYAQLLQRYKVFFSTEPLDRLHLPNETYSFEVPRSDSLLMRPSTATVSIMLRAFFMQKAPYERYTHMTWSVYEQYLRNLDDPSAGPQFETPSEHIFSIIVANLGLSRYNLPRAVTVLQHMLMTSSLPNPTIITWNPLMRSYARHGDISGAEKVWNLIVGHGLRPDDHSYNALLLAYVRAGQSDEAGRLLARMLKEGWKWNYMTNATVSMARDKKLLLEALEDEKRRLGLGAEEDPLQSSSVGMNTAYDPISELFYEELPLE